ncbi:unnamed protein product, partial [Nesidiocoris tenuis]
MNEYNRSMLAFTTEYELLVSLTRMPFLFALKTWQVPQAKQECPCWYPRHLYAQDVRPRREDYVVFP